MRPVVVVLLAVGLASGSYWVANQVKQTQSTQSGRATGTRAPGTAPAIAAAGDIACDPDSPKFNGGRGTATACRMQATAQLLLNEGLTAVLPLGDLQYEVGSAEAFQKSYAPSWGRLKSITRPVVGNHEYEEPGAASYYRYFGAAAGSPQRGYYSYDIGQWHLIALNSNCSEVGGCGIGSPQERWLKADLAAHPRKCTLAYWHHPRFSSGHHGNNSDTQAFWQALAAAGADVVLAGHDHHYERFAPQTPQGKLDPDRGIRQFVVGTGGKNHYELGEIQPHSQVRNADTYGVLKLTLHPTRYDWRFISEAGKSFSDSGNSPCH
ncbi:MULTISPECIES: metallophosphoesterase [Trichocoleus]|uniref:Metallophosphoesterase n=1 Tax=Trichocoleus desertorum GB2-A4 TaxID=2933944 RepID=A0ABV0J853_9CYAN|nr:metallophosphoesterase [Trichocoleus sp. FACHB-46]MBD1862313.1 metallophosphoesterase [Trichocoleus sp. FACHB-46]